MDYKLLIILFLIGSIPLFGGVMATDLTIQKDTTADDLLNYTVYTNSYGIDQFWVDENGFVYANGTLVASGSGGVGNLTLTQYIAFDSPTDNLNMSGVSPSQFTIKTPTSGAGVINLETGTVRIQNSETGSSTPNLQLKRNNAGIDGQATFIRFLTKDSTGTDREQSMQGGLRHITAGAKNGTIEWAVYTNDVSKGIGISGANNALIPTSNKGWSLGVDTGIDGELAWNKIVGDSLFIDSINSTLGCSNGQILEYNSGGGYWACGTDDVGAGGGGGSNGWIALINSTDSSAPYTFDWSGVASGMDTIDVTMFVDLNGGSTIGIQFDGETASEYQYTNFDDFTTVSTSTTTYWPMHATSTSGMWLINFDCWFEVNIVCDGNAKYRDGTQQAEVSMRKFSHTGSFTSITVVPVTGAFDSVTAIVMGTNVDP